jgi:hypothetical protein
MLVPGEKIEFRYPVSTHVGTHPEFRDRSVTVLSIRDTVRDPLTLDEFVRRPYVRRSRWLISSIEGQNYRQFYLGNSEEFRAPSQLSVGIFDLEKNTRIDTLFRRFDADPREVKTLLRLLAKYRDHDFGDAIELRVWADDLALHRAG